MSQTQQVQINLDDLQQEIGAALGEAFMATHLARAAARANAAEVQSLRLKLAEIGTQMQARNDDPSDVPAENS